MQIWKCVLDLFTHRDLTKAEKIYPQKYMQNLEYCKLFFFLGIYQF